MRYEFGAYVIDTERVELRHGSKLLNVEPQVFDVLVYLIRNHDRVVSGEELFDALWVGRVVSMSTLTSRITAARKAIGDNGIGQNLIKTIHRRGYRFIGEVKEAPEASAPANDLLQEIQFCISGNGVHIAYARVGSGPPLVKAGNWLSHLEYDWESPVWSHMLRWIASEHELVRYDARGNGLSDRDVEEISFDAFVRDLESVADAAGLDRFVLFGISQGAAVSIAYAEKHPERVSKLVIYGGFARGTCARGAGPDAAEAEASVTLMRTGWGQENPAFRQVFTSLFMPSGTPEQMQWFIELQRNTTTAENAIRTRLVSDNLNVTELLPRISMPTLVMHCRDDAVQPFEEGRLLAAGIPGAKFMGLKGNNHLILESDPGWHHFKEEFTAFLAE